MQLQIEGVKNGYLVKVKINNVDPPLEIAVDRTNKGLSYWIF